MWITGDEINTRGIRDKDPPATLEDVCMVLAEIRDLNPGAVLGIVINHASVTLSVLRVGELDDGALQDEVVVNAPALGDEDPAAWRELCGLQAVVDAVHDLVLIGVGVVRDDDDRVPRLVVPAEQHLAPDQGVPDGRVALDIGAARAARLRGARQRGVLLRLLLLL